MVSKKGKGRVYGMQYVISKAVGIGIGGIGIGPILVVSVSVSVQRGIGEFLYRYQSLYLIVAIDCLTVS